MKNDARVQEEMQDSVPDAAVEWGRQDADITNLDREETPVWMRIMAF